MKLPDSVHEVIQAYFPSLNGIELEGKLAFVSKRASVKSLLLPGKLLYHSGFPRSEEGSPRLYAHHFGNIDVTP